MAKDPRVARNQEIMQQWKAEGTNDPKVLADRLNDTGAVPWTAEEDQMLREAVLAHPARNFTQNNMRWKIISDQVNSYQNGIRRGKKDCRARHRILKGIKGLTGSAAPGNTALDAKRVICDGCENGVIQGIRYKSATVDDYDLCEGCEEAGTFDHKGPFIKIRHPSLAPAAIAIVAMPPPAMAHGTPIARAATPLSNAPNSFEAPMDTLSTAVTRPSCEFGVASGTSVERMVIETMSAPAAMTSETNATT